MAAHQHHYNQLLFNLEVPAKPTNMAVKFRHPEPLVVEKFGPNLTPMSTPIKSQPSMPVSELRWKRWGILKRSRGSNAVPWSIGAMHQLLVEIDRRNLDKPV